MNDETLPGEPTDQRVIDVARMIANDQSDVTKGSYDRWIAAARKWPGCYSHTRLLRTWKIAAKIVRYLEKPNAK